MNDSFGRALRMLRFYHHGDGRLFVVPLDHSVTEGPVVGEGSLDDLVGQICDNGADAVVLHKGSLRHVRPRWFGATSLFVHMSASTARGPEPDAKCIVASVEEAMRLGADGVSVHINLGSRHERQQIVDLASVGDACDRWNVPLLAMVYPRGPNIPDPRDPRLVAHAVTIAADLGADLVKTVFPRSVDAMREIAAGCPIPILAAGGPARAEYDDIVASVGDALDGGAAGVAMGRTIFSAPDPGAMTRKISDLIHGWHPPSSGRWWQGGQA